MMNIRQATTDDAKTLAELNKVKITFAVTLTTMAGYALAKNSIDSGLILPMLGIFILAWGSGALNHYQDRDKDGLMDGLKPPTLTEHVVKQPTQDEYEVLVNEFWRDAHCVPKYLHASVLRVDQISR